MMNSSLRKMHRSIGIILLTFTVCVKSYAVPSFSGTIPEPLKKKINESSISVTPYGFLENKGQIFGPDGKPFPQAKFVFQDNTTKVFLLEKGIAYQFTKTHYPQRYLDIVNGDVSEKNTEEITKLRGEIRQETYRMDMFLKGANSNAKVTEEGVSKDFVNYLGLNILDVRSYQKITYHNVYPNIDWVIYLNDGKMKYDFIVRPGGDPSDIKLGFENQESVALDGKGSLVLKNSFGSVTEKAPVSFQNNRNVITRFNLSGNTLSFKLGYYDKNEILRIDPSLIWATYYGDTQNEVKVKCAADASGNIYLTGATASTINIAIGGYQNTFIGTMDVFVVKFNSAGGRVWGTYFGGPNWDNANDITIGPQGNIYIAGMTQSSFGLGNSGHQTSYGGSDDAFLAKFAPNGALLWSTYYGGSGADAGYGCTVDASGNVYMVGTTASTANIASGGYQTGKIGPTDAFLVKFNTSGVRLWSTYYGALNDEAGYSCACDAYNNVFVGGSTNSGGGISFWGHQNSYGGALDGFLVKFDSLCGLQWCSYYGDTGNDVIYSCAVDQIGDIYVGGETNSTAGIFASGHDNSLDGTKDAFVAKFNTVGTRLWGTYYGGTGIEPANTNCRVITDINGNVFLCGETTSSISIASGGFQNTLLGTSDGFLVKFNNTGTRQWGTYYGGAGAETDIGCATGVGGNVYICGVTTSTSGIASSGFQNAMQSQAFNDAFLAKFCDLIPTQPGAISGATTVCSNSTPVFSVTQDPVAVTYQWNFPAGWTGSSTTNTISVTPGATGIVTVTAFNPCGSSPSRTLNVVVLTPPILTITPSNTFICSADVLTISASGASTYSWSGGLGSGASVTLTPASNFTSVVTGTAVNGCTASATRSFVVNTSPVLTITPSATVMCTGNTTTLTGAGATTYTWAGGPSSAVFTVNPISNSSYSLTGTAANGCTNYAVQSVSVNTSPLITITPSSTLICSGTSVTLTAANASTYTWTSGPTTSSNVVTPGITTDFTVTGTNAVGCTSVAIQNISVNITPTVTVTSPSTVICTGKSATLTANNADTYTWTSGPGTASYVVNPFTTTSYTVAGTNTLGGCSSSAVQNVSVNASPTINIATTSTVVCTGKTATLTASNANTYTWTSGPINPNYVVSPFSSSNFTVTGTNSAGGCTATAVQNISVNPSPTINISTTGSIICLGNSATLTAANANTFTWTSGPSTASIVATPTSNTNYTVTGTNTVGNCTATAVQLVSVVPIPVVNISQTSTVLCTGKTATLTGTGASSYVWTGGPATSTFVVSPFNNTNYTVTGTTASGGCSATAVTSMSVNPSPTISIAATSTVFCSASGTTPTLTASNANSYTWTAGPATSTNVVSPVSTTNYTVTGTNSIGNCTANAIQTISVTITPTINISATSTIICTGKNTTLTAITSPTGLPMTFSWTSGSSSSVSVVSPFVYTSYTVTGTNTAGNCTNTAAIDVSVNPSPTISIAATSTVICSGNSTTLTASNADSFTWTAGPVSSINAVSPAFTTIYTVTGTYTNSAGNCTANAFQTVSVNATPTINIAATTTVICTGKTTTLTASNANTYTWVAGPNTASNPVSPFTTSIYTVSGTNTLGGCIGTAFKTVSVNPSPTVNIAATNTVICSGTTVTLTASNANTYLWTFGPAFPTVGVSPIITTNYTVTGTNSAGNCTGTAVQQISVNTTPTVNITTTGTVICFGKTTTLTANNAATFTWTGGPATATNAVSPAATTVYTVIGESAVGNCTAQAVKTVSVNSLPSLSVTAGPDSVLCSGKILTLTASGAASYAWTGGPSNPVFMLVPLASAVYTVKGTNTVSGCTNTAVKSITVNQTPLVVITPTYAVICTGDTATLTASGANSYTWTGGPTIPIYTMSPFVSTTYTVIGTAPNGCTNSAVRVLNVNVTPTVSVSGPTFICSGKAILSASGATNYLWSNGLTSPAININQTSSTSYTVTGTSFSCTSSATIYVATPPIVSPTLCLVKVDSTGKYNEIYWNKTSFPRADTFYVFRETAPAIFAQIAKIPKSAPGMYVDTNRTIGPIKGDPLVSSHKYRIQFKDSCGLMSPFSPYHQTMYIKDTQNGFVWNNYFIEFFGTLPASHELWRRDLSTGTGTLVNSTAATATTDPSYSAVASSGNVKWYVAIKGFFDCAPFRSTSNLVNETQFPFLLLNVKNNSDRISTMRIYPNPSQSWLNIESSPGSGQFEFTVVDVAGRNVMTGKIADGHTTLDVRELENGIYFLNFSDSGRKLGSQKIIVQH